MVHPSASAAVPVALVAAAVLMLAGCGGAGGQSTPRQAKSAAAHRALRSKPRPPVGVRVAYRPLYSLPAPLRDPAYAPLGSGRFVMLGGLDAADVSTSEVDVADLHGAHSVASLPEAQHDAQAAALGRAIYVFGGGGFTELDHILRFDPATAQVRQVGALSAPQSDVAVAQAGATAYVVGGFDGVRYLDTVVAWHPGGAPVVEAHLPVGLRYAAVAVAGGGLLVMGGSTPAGAGDAIYRFDLTTHLVRRIGTLREPVTHANAAVVDGRVYLIGGRSDSLTGQTRAVWAIDPATGRVRAAGHLPTPLSDATAITIGRAIVVAGGQSPTSTQSAVGELAPAAVR